MSCTRVCQLVYMYIYTHMDYSLVGIGWDGKIINSIALEFQLVSEDRLKKIKLVLKIILNGFLYLQNKKYKKYIFLFFIIFCLFCLILNFEHSFYLFSALCLHQLFSFYYIDLRYPIISNPLSIFYEPLLLSPSSSFSRHLCRFSLQQATL